ncbi:MAG: acyltransferase [Maioricimonas sp. JB049]
MSERIARSLWRCTEICRLASARARSWYWAGRGAAVGRKCLFGHSVRIDRPWTAVFGQRCVLEPDVWLNVVDDEARVAIGDFAFLGRGVEIGASLRVVVGRDALIGPGVFITDHSHRCDSPAPIRSQGCRAAPVLIEEDVWIGAGCIILPGVTIGAGAVVGAGSVVTRDIAARTVVAGSPARLLRHRPFAAVQSAAASDLPPMITSLPETV